MAESKWVCGVVPRAHGGHLVDRSPFPTAAPRDPPAFVTRPTLLGGPR